MKKILSNILALAFLLLSFTPVFAQEETELVLLPSVSQAFKGEEFTVEIKLNNPMGQKVISVRAWLEYNRNALEALNIDTENTPLALAAPGEDNIAQEEGLIKIGRSNVEGGVTDSEVTVATVSFRVKTPNSLTTSIKAYDYQVTELGHTSVNIIEQGFPVNILSKEPDELRFPLNPGGAPIPVADVSASTETIGATEGIGGAIMTADLTRPANVQIDTGFGYADLKWDMADNELSRTGYNIYYGKTSGQYTRRRSIDNVDNYRLEGLNNNETYFFALTAYDYQNRESDYSDEVGIIINQPLSSTSPFIKILQAMLAQLPAQPQNGPLVGWLVFSAVGLGGALMFRKSKNENLKRMKT